MMEHCLVAHLELRSAMCWARRKVLMMAFLMANLMAGRWDHPMEDHWVENFAHKMVHHLALCLERMCELHLDPRMEAHWARDLEQHSELHWALHWVLQKESHSALHLACGLVQYLAA
mmetsp:Transcript_22041/g.65278  ORF Transcript_22041/g.65278 Transcript_22041/m.65278 type:complete len:117 (-) Transcript_22041:142-492(-)